MAGAIRYFLFHPTAVNLLMILLIVAGAASYLNLNTQLWPTWETRNVSVSISWPGASVDAMNRLVAKPLDLQLKTISRVEEFNTHVDSGSLYASLDFQENTDMQTAFSETQSKVASIATFPTTIEKPVITLGRPLEHVTRILVYGDFSDRVASNISKELVEALKTAGIRNIKVRGLKQRQVNVNLDPIAAREFSLTPETVAGQIQGAVREGSGGVYQQGNAKFNTRVERYGDINSLGDIAITMDKQTIRLRDLARVTQDYPENSFGAVFPEGKGFFVQIRRDVDQDTIEQTLKIEKVIGSFQAELPPGISIQLYDTRASQISDRLSLLQENALLGLALVSITLLVFLNLRAAIWVVLGIPVAFAATFCLMWLTGQTINMVSAFAMVMVLGIIVDDAIVVVENITTVQREGNDPCEDAWRATMAMWKPVLTATLTTIAAFAPILLLTDVFGTYVKAIPWFICTALIASLVECFFLLPAHMRVSARPKKQYLLRQKIDGWQAWFVNNPFQWFIRTVYENRLIPAMALVLFLALAVLLALTHAVRFQFWLNPESNFIYANVTLLPGVDEMQRKQVINDLWQALHQAEEKSGYRPGQLVKTSFALEGYHFARGGTNTADPARVSVFLELNDPDGKRMPAGEFAQLWKALTPGSANVQALEISPNRSGPAGSDIHLVLKGSDIDQMNAALAQTQAALSRIDGVRQISDTQASSQLDVVLSLLPQGRDAGFKSQTLSQQLFAGIGGVKAHTLEDEGESLDIRVRYARGKDLDALLDVLPVTSPDGHTHTIPAIADVGYGYTKNAIVRQNGEMSVSILADIDRDKIDAPAVWQTIDETIVPAVQADTGVKFAHKGKREERDKAFDEITWSFIVGIAAIYCILAWSMESMWWPFAVLAVLPLGSAGAIFGHFLLDYKVTMLSLVSLIALYGILVNDSIILFGEIRQRRSAGDDWKTATITGYMARLRPILLTSITTIAGLSPLILEQDYQAQFLIPIAITITFGLGISTLGSFLLVPVMVGYASSFKASSTRI